MAYIEVITPQQAAGKLADSYRKVSGPGGQVDHVLQVHSLRPHTLDGHMALYKAVLHQPQNRLPTWFLEAIGVLVSLLNDCVYCARHHAAGMQRQLRKKPGLFEAYRAQLESDAPGEPFTEAELAALRYARKLTLEPGEIQPQDIDELRSAGLDDGRILEVNQVAAYFAYANRTVTGLGVELAGEQLGLSPEEENSDEVDSHA